MMTSGRVSRVSTLAMTTRSINPDVGSRCSPRYKNPWIPIGLIVERRKKRRGREILSLPFPCDCEESAGVGSQKRRRDPSVRDVQPDQPETKTEASKEEQQHQSHGTWTTLEATWIDLQKARVRARERERANRTTTGVTLQATFASIRQTPTTHPLAPDRPFVVCCAVPVSSTGINSKLTSFVELRDDGRNLPTVLKTSLAKSLSLSVELAIVQANKSIV